MQYLFGTSAIFVRNKCNTCLEQVHYLLGTSAILARNNAIHVMLGTSIVDDFLLNFKAVKAFGVHLFCNCTFHTERFGQSYTSGQIMQYNQSEPHHTPPDFIDQDVPHKPSNPRN